MLSVVRMKTIPTFNLTQNNIKQITWGEVLEKGRAIIYDYPFEGQVWYPDGDIRSSKLIHNLFVFFFHIIPAYLIDFLMLILRQKRLYVYYMFFLYFSVSFSLSELYFCFFFVLCLRTVWSDFRSEFQSVSRCCNISPQETGCFTIGIYTLLITQ